MPSQLRRQELAASALAGSGFSRWTRQRQQGRVAVLTFHGLSESEVPEGVLDASLHVSLPRFRRFCEYLAKHYDVVRLGDVVTALEAGVPTSTQTRGGRPQVALTFDDGYASNHDLALPLLSEFELPATVFVSTAFVEGELLWFQQLDLLFQRAGQGMGVRLSQGGESRAWTFGEGADRAGMLMEALSWMKTLPSAEQRLLIEETALQLGQRVPGVEDAPEVLKPLSWDQVRALDASEWVEIGGHTHSHPILSRCREEDLNLELGGSIKMLADQIGRQPVTFAYPNGGAQDFDRDVCADHLHRAGVRAAFSMLPGAVTRHSDRWNLPRFGAPESKAELEATVSGAFETLSRWRGNADRSNTMPAERPTVLHFISRVGGGGAESMLVNLVEHLADSRWRVVVVAIDGREHPEQAARLEAACDRYVDLQEDGFLRRSTLARLASILREEQPEVMQTWMHHADLVGGLVARWVGGIRVVWGIHCREIHRSPGESAAKLKAFETAIGQASKRVPAKVISCSKVALEDHVARGYPRNKMVWIPNGIDLQRFRPDEAARRRTRESLAIDPAVPLIGFVGRWHEMKNLPLLLRAFVRLQQELPQAHLALCGVERSELDETSLEILQGVELQVRFLPFRSDPEAFYPALDLFALSSRTEACPMTLIEALACGVPCVATDVGDCGIVIGDAGRVVEAGDEEGMAKALATLLQAPPGESEARKAAARTQAESHFGIERAVEGYTGVYEQLLEVAA